MSDQTDHQRRPFELSRAQLAVIGWATTLSMVAVVVSVAVLTVWAVTGVIGIR